MSSVGSVGLFLHKDALEQLRVLLGYNCRLHFSLDASREAHASSDSGALSLQVQWLSSKVWLQILIAKDTGARADKHGHSDACRSN